MQLYSKLSLKAGVSAQAGFRAWRNMRMHGDRAKLLRPDGVLLCSQELRDSKAPYTPHSACTDCGLAMILLVFFLRLLFCAGFPGARPELPLLGPLGAQPPGTMMLLCMLDLLPI